MKAFTGLLITCVAVPVFSSSCSATVDEEMQLTSEEAVTALVDGNNGFAFDLYREVASADREADIFFSPYSISSALGMTYCGARGETASDMAEVLHFTMNSEALNGAFKTMLEELSSGSLNGAETGDPFTLAISSGLWVQSGFNLLDSFVSQVTDTYSAPVENLDFINNSEGSRETINSWVAEKTLNKILNLIPAGVLNADTRLVLTNAVYFKGSWEHPFSEYATHHGEFNLVDGSVVNVPVMEQTEHFRYCSTGEYSAVELGYAGGSASMLVIAPSGDFAEFEQRLNGEFLESVRDNLSRENLHLSMPVFEFTESIQLGSILSSMGMESAFGSNADFSGITGNRDLFISDVIHKAFVKVDEAGTEAAAATAVVMSLQAMAESPAEMNLNRPFVFIIQNNETGSIVFMGRVMNPAV